MQEESQVDVRAILNQNDPAALDSYLRQFEEGKALPRNTMLTVYEIAVARAFHALSLEWAALAIRAAQLFALQDCGEYSHDAFYRAMHVRLHFIKRLGSRSGDFVLDKSFMIRWVEQVDLSLDEVKARSARWQTARSVATGGLSHAELLEMRHIKRRIYFVKELAVLGQLSDDSPMNDWIAVYSQLP